MELEKEKERKPKESDYGLHSWTVSDEEEVLLNPMRRDDRKVNVIVWCRRGLP